MQLALVTIKRTDKAWYSITHTGFLFSLRRRKKNCLQLYYYFFVHVPEDWPLSGRSCGEPTYLGSFSSAGKVWLVAFRCRTTHKGPGDRWLSLTQVRKASQWGLSKPWLMYNFILGICSRVGKTFWSPFLQVFQGNDMSLFLEGQTAKRGNPFASLDNHFE